MTVPASERSLILVVTADSGAGTPVQQSIESLGFRTVTASDGPQAIETAATHHPDLCVVVAAAGRDTGLDVCKRLKRHPRTVKVPLLMVTEDGDPGIHARAADAGADDILTTLAHPALLGARVRALLRLKTAMDALDESGRRMRELEKVRDDLMKMIVHDLKTPLTTVLATLEILADGDLGPVTGEQAGAIVDMRARGDELLRLIDDLLQVWRIEATSLQLALEEIVPATFVEELMKEWEYRFRQEKADVSLDIAVDAKPLRGDRGLLRRVFGNLFQNALTHSGSPVELRVSVREDRRGVLFTVADSGTGIPREYQEVIFRKFHRIPRPNDSHVRGSGLGLAFCRIAVEAHGGRIWVQSEEGEGAAFHVLLPHNPAAAVMRSVWNI
jgi:two-component system, sensor histidine kinase and response regulator